MLYVMFLHITEQILSSLTYRGVALQVFQWPTIVSDYGFRTDSFFAHILFFGLVILGGFFFYVPLCIKIYSSERSNEMKFALMRALLILPPHPHSSPKISIQSFQHSCWITFGPFFSPFGKNNERLTDLCKWTHCENNGFSLKRNRIFSQDTRSILLGLLWQKEQNDGEHHASIAQQQQQQHMWETEHH